LGVGAGLFEIALMMHFCSLVMQIVLEKLTLWAELVRIERMLSEGILLYYLLVLVLVELGLWVGW
jgi:hypothetical protein